MKSIMRYIFTLLLLCMQILCFAATIDESDLYKIGLPLLTITTTDGTEPQGYPVYPPEGCVGVGLAGNEYVSGRLVITLGDSVLYDSGEYMNKVSGMQIRQRGNTSSLWNKKPYKIKLSKKADLLFRGDSKYKDKDWLLLREGTTLNVPVGFKVSELVGQRWTPKYSYVNLVINNDYKGCYVLTESIEVEEGRCDISDTGFIVEDDAYWWNEDVSFKGSILPYQMGYTFKSPDYDDISARTFENITNYIYDVENALVNGECIYEYIDVTSFAAWLLGHDILGTSDAAGSNRYLVKYDFFEDNPTSSLLEMGPLWDFDDIFKREDMWSQQHSGNYKFYYKYLLEDKWFLENYCLLWETLSATLYDNMMDYVYNLRDSIGPEIDASRELDDRRWGRSKPSNSVAADAEYISSWFGKRVLWINNEIFSWDFSSVADIVNDFRDKNFDVYKINGQLYMNNVTPEQLKGLPKGIYVYGGKKIIVY